MWSSLLSHASNNALISVASRRGKVVDVELFWCGVCLCWFQVMFKMCKSDYSQDLALCSTLCFQIKIRWSFYLGPGIVSKAKFVHPGSEKHILTIIHTFRHLPLSCQSSPLSTDCTENLGSGFQTVVGSLVWFAPHHSGTSGRPYTLADILYR